jgi:hypothetical protein
MSSRLCPRCERPARLLKDSSTNALVDYYRCDRCNEVWVVDRKDPDTPLRSVTLPRDSPDGKP